MNLADLTSKLTCLHPSIDWKPDPIAALPTCTGKISAEKTVQVEVGETSIKVEMKIGNWTFADWADPRSLDECQGAIAMHLDWLREYVPRNRDAPESVVVQTKSRYKIKPL